MTFDRWLLLAACAALLIAIYLAGWWYRDCPRWFLGCACRDDLPGPALARTDALMGQPANRAGGLHDNEWDADWQREPWTDADADQLIADLRGEPQDGCVAPSSPMRAANRESADRGTLFDSWWAGLDGLERECMLVHDLVVREARKWAEIKAETREMCAA